MCECVPVLKDACLCATTCAFGCGGTLKDPSLSSLRCVNKQSVLLIFSRACPAAAPALLVVTAEPWQLKSVGIVLPADAVCSMWVRVRVCFLPSAAVGGKKKKSSIADLCQRR